MLEASNFRGMKQILSELQPDVDANSILELKERVHFLCARFLGGAWKNVQMDELLIQRLRGGMSNMLFLCRLPYSHQPLLNEPNKVLLRVYFNPETECHLVGESVIFTLLSERHLGPKLYGIFSGGRLEEYIPSRPLSCTEISLKEISNIIARRLARIHQLEVPIWKEPDYLCDALTRWLRQLIQTNTENHCYELPECYQPWSPKSINYADISKEFTFVKECIEKSRSAVVFCHNDLQEGNILLPKASSGNISLESIGEENCAYNNSLQAFNPANPKLVIIDFEYASYNYRGFDFANHFIEYCIDYDVDVNPYYKIDDSKFPSVERQMEFFDSYVREISSATSAEIFDMCKQMFEEVKPFIAVSHFFWGVWGLLQVELSPIGFGFEEYGCDRLGLYYKNRQLLNNLLHN